MNTDRLLMGLSDYLNHQEANLVIKDMEDRKPVYLSGMWHYMPEDGQGRWFKIKVPSFWNTPEQFDHRENWKEIDEAWYGYNFYIDEEIGNKKGLFLCFEGVSLLCDVYVNQNLVGSHGGCFTPFEFDITHFVNENALNTILLRVRDLSHAYSSEDNALYHQVGLMELNGHIPDPFMPDHPAFGGIWQPVSIQRRPLTHIKNIRVITSVAENTITAELDVHAADEGELSVKAFVCDNDDSEVKLSFPLAGLDMGCCGAKRHLILKAGWPDLQLWSPENPKLYYLNIELYVGDALIDKQRIRFGFREFSIQGRHFYLNGKKVRLYGESINKMEQMFCSNHRKDYISLLYKTLKEELNINCLRLHSMIAPKVMIDAADEIGLLIINQSGIWSSAGEYYRRGGERFLQNTRIEFEEWIWRDINSPSVIAWDVENEMLRGSHINTWALRLDQFVKDIDNTRPIIHSGSGTLMGRAEFYHYHHDEHYTELVEKWLKNPDKPMVIGEWWIGGKAGIPRNITGFDTKEYNAFEEIKSKLYREAIIELRTMGVEGVMPYSFLNYAFRPLFDYRQRISLSDCGRMEPCPDFASPYGDDIGIGYELVNPGWDNTRPHYRISHTFAGALKNAFSPVAVFIAGRDKYIKSGRLQRTLVVINDTADERELHVEWQLKTGGHAVNGGDFTVRLGNCERKEICLGLDVPVSDGDMQMVLSATVSECGMKLHEDCHDMIIISETEQKAGHQGLILYDTKGCTEDLFKKMGIGFSLIDIEDIKSHGIRGKCLIIGAYSGGSELVQVKQQLLDFAESGGRIWVMQQSEPVAWLPVNLGFTSSEVQVPPSYAAIVDQPTTKGIYYSRYVPVYMTQHPVFNRIPQLIERWKHHDGRVVDDVYVKPLASGERALYNIRVLSGGTRQDHASSLEIYIKEGIYLLTQFKIVENVLSDPLCRRLFFNIVDYMLAGETAFRAAKTAVLGEETRLRLKRQYRLDLPLLGEDSLSEYQNLIIGSEIPWDSTIEKWLEPWVNSGGTAILFERQPGNVSIFGNTLEVLPNSLLSTDIYVYPGNGITAGLYGTDTEIAKGSVPAKYSMLIEGRDAESQVLNGRPVIPLVQLVRKNKKAWWYNSPVKTCGLGAVQVISGSGSVVLWQLDVFGQDALSAHFMRTLLTNAGVRMEPELGSASAIKVLHADEIVIDGNIEEWICDMEDTNVTKWKHADPVVIPAHALYSGTVRDNSDASGVVYFMYDSENLYAAAQVIDNIVCPATETETGDGIAFEIDGVYIQLEILENQRLKVRQKINGELYDIDRCVSCWKGAGAVTIRQNRDAAFIFGGISNPYFRGYTLECTIPWESIKGLDRGRTEWMASVYIIDVDRPHKAESRLAYPAEHHLKARFALEQK